VALVGQHCIATVGRCGVIYPRNWQVLEPTRRRHHEANVALDE